MDAVLLEEEPYRDPEMRVRAGAPRSLRTPLARRLAEAVDLRVLLMMKAARSFPKAHADLRIRAKAMAHAVTASEAAHDIADRLLREPADAAVFVEYIETQMESMPEERRAEYRAALDVVMPKLFPGWTPPLFED
jgi:hypothetical protein